jgi:hypothetical protein
MVCYFDLRIEVRYRGAILWLTCMPVAVAMWTRELLFNQEIAGSNPGRRIFLSFFLFFFFFFYIQIFFYTIMKLVITLLENVNKSRTSAGSLSLVYSLL